MKKLQILSFLTVLFVLSTSAYAVNLRFNLMYNNKHPLSKKVFAPWAEKVKEVTDGRVKVTLFYSNALFKPKDALGAVSKRVADIGLILPAYNRNKLMMSSVLDQPMVAGGNTSVNSEVAWQVSQEVPEVMKELESVKILWAYMSPTFQLHFSKSKPESLESLNNAIISGGGTSQTHLLRLLGTSPEAMPMVEVFLAMQKGVIDGCLLPYAPLRSQKIAELVHHHVNANLMAVSFFVGANKKVWSKISPEDQKAIEAISGVVASRQSGEVFDSAQVRDLQLMKEKGDTFYDLSDEQKEKWVSMIKPVSERWINDAKKKGYSDPEKVLNQVKQLVADKTK